MIGLAHASKARSHSRSGSRSPRFRKTDDGSRDCLARWIDHAPVAQSLDGGFEYDAQETRGLWIQPLPIQILSDRHVENSSPPKATIWFLQGTLVGRVSYQKTQKLVYFFSQGEQDFAMVSLDLSRTSAPPAGMGTSVILPAGKQTNDEGQGLDAADISTDQGLRQRKALMVLAAEYWEPGAVSPSALFPKRGSRPSHWPAVPILRGCPLRRPMFPCLRLLAEPAAAVPAAVR